MKSMYTADFSEIHIGDIARVGGKNASLGEMFNALKPKGVGVLDGFAITTDAYWRLLEEQNLRAKLENVFANLVWNMRGSSRSGETFHMVLYPGIRVARLTSERSGRADPTSLPVPDRDTYLVRLTVDTLCGITFVRL